MIWDEERCQRLSTPTRWYEFLLSKCPRYSPPYLVLMYDFFPDQCPELFAENIPAMLSCCKALNWSNQLVFSIWSKRWESAIDVDYTPPSENFIEWPILCLIHESWLQSTELFAWRLQRTEIWWYLSIVAANRSYRKEQRKHASCQHIWQFQPWLLSWWSKYQWLCNWPSTADYWSIPCNPFSPIQLEWSPMEWRIGDHLCCG